MSNEVAEKLKQNLKSQVFLDIDQLEGKKTIVWQNDVLRKIDLLIGATEFSEHHVSRHILMPSNFDKGSVLNVEGTNNVVFVVAPTKQVFTVLKGILLVKKTGVSYHVRVVTKPSTQLTDIIMGDSNAERKIKTFKLWPFFWAPSFGDFVLNTFSIDPIKLFLQDDFDLIRLCSGGFGELGKIPVVRYKGRWAEKIVKSIKNDTGKTGVLFDELIVVDREVDPLTPFLSQYSFSGIMDDMFGIDVKNNIKVPKEVLERKEFVTNATNKDGVEIKLGNDAYKDVIHLSLKDAVAKIRSVFKELSVIENTHSQLNSVNDFKNYMPALQQLSQKKEKVAEILHLLTIAYCRNAQFSQKTLYEFERSVLHGEVSASTVSPVIEMMLVKGGDSEDGLKTMMLVVIQSLVNSGLQPRVWNEYQRMAVQSYGIEAIKWCLNLETVGLVSDVNDKTSKYNWIPNELKKLRVLADPEQDKKADFYSGYVPLLVRVLEKGIRDNWKSFDCIDPDEFSSVSTLSRRTALFVIGGLTRAELACLKSLDFRAVYITNILQSNDLIQLCKYKE
ncbi:unnamed protein product [Bursaphelenchus okinawaensis]|uniref:Uncharacterized protein n=1 Tax=Bursaphelenchus okinawaensis TaxID=465554 RepID=A0A811KGX9_9BILA|nr:unnamed protein product [Bursaphelenchus okinawaensis]CAG9104282.1 unnamed protein product [Bursaphelenchus okinawaensis]